MPTEHLFPYVAVALVDLLSWHSYSLLTPLSSQTLLGRGKRQQPDFTLSVSQLNVQLLFTLI